MVFVADALGGWLVGQLADAGRKKLTELVLGSEQQRALRRAADVAVWATAEEVSPCGGEQAGQVAMVISEVFRDPVPDAPRAGPVMLLEGLQAGIAGQLAVLDDAGLTGTGQSSADVMGVPGAVLADRLTCHLVREIIVHGSGGGPLAPLADQFNHELTRLQIGGMLAQLATEVRDALTRPGGGVTVAGRPLEEVTDPFALEVHRPVEPDVPRPELPVLPVYVPRDHDAALAKVVTAGAIGTSGIAVLVGGSSTGKTRACWQALELLCGQELGWRLWHPIDPQAALAGLPGASPRTVIWLNEAQRYLGTADGTGERVAAGLRELLRDRVRGPVLVLATLWPEFWDELTARPPGGADPHAQARELLTGRNIPVSAAFTGEQLRLLEEAGDPRLAQAAAGSRDGHVIQYLAGAPDLLDRYRNAPPAARALIDAAMDAARLGMRSALPRAFLEAAAPGYLTDADWDLLPRDWLEQALGYTSKPCKGVRGPLTLVQPRPTLGIPDSPGSGPAWQLADYLDQHGRRTRREEIPPASFWAAAASYAEPAGLDSLGEAAENRGLFRDAARLYKQASAHGDPIAGAHLVRLLHTLHPGDQRPADWAATHASLNEPNAVASLLNELRQAGAVSHVTALASRAVPHASLDDPAAMANLIHALRMAGATGQVAALLDRDPATHASLNYASSVRRLLHALHAAGATGQLTALASRAAAHVSLDNPAAVANLLRALREAGVTGQVAALASRAATQVSLGDPLRVARLLDTLSTVRATAQIITLLDRNPAADSSLDDPGSVATLLDSILLSWSAWDSAEGQIITLLDRNPAARTSLDNPGAVARLLEMLQLALVQPLGRGQAITLLGRDPAAHVGLSPPGGVALLLRVLRKAGAAGQVTALASRAAAHVSLDDPAAVANLLDALRAVEATGQVTILLGRDPAAHVSLDDLDTVASLLDVLRIAGATGQVTALASRAATHVSLDNPAAVANLIHVLREAGATGQVTALASRAAAHASLDGPYGVAKLLDVLREAGARAQAAELIERLPGAGLFQLFRAQEDCGEQFRFGRDANGRPAKPWAWTDLG